MLRARILALCVATSVTASCETPDALESAAPSESHADAATEKRELIKLVYEKGFAGWERIERGKLPNDIHLVLANDVKLARERKGRIPQSVIPLQFTHQGKKYYALYHSYWRTGDKDSLTGNARLTVYIEKPSGPYGYAPWIMFFIDRDAHGNYVHELTDSDKHRMDVSTPASPECDKLSGAAKTCCYCCDREGAAASSYSRIPVIGGCTCIDQGNEAGNEAATNLCN
jgi:hypothetical protein